MHPNPEITVIGMSSALCPEDSANAPGIISAGHDELESRNYGRAPANEASGLFVYLALSSGGQFWLAA